MELFIFMAWLTFTVAIYLYAKRLGRSGGIFVLISLVLSPLLTFVLLLAMGKKEKVLVDKNGVEFGKTDGRYEWKD